MDSTFMLITGLEILVLVLAGFLFLVLSKFPFIFKLIFAKTAVFEIQDNGIATPVKSKSIAGAMVTKNGTYLYTKNDVIRWCGITCIIANKDSDARAINPDVAPILSLFKKHNVDSLEDVEAILKAPLVTPEVYARMLKEQQEAQEQESI